MPHMPLLTNPELREPSPTPCVEYDQGSPDVIAPRKPPFIAVWWAAGGQSDMRSSTNAIPTRRGFSLLELMLVLVIISILGTTAALALRNRAAEARVTATESTLRTVEQALDQYNFAKGTYPTMNEWRENILVPSYLKETPVDAWKRPIYYTYPTNNPAQPFEL
ncbi:MAG: type II secretion system protein GspG, partial [Planctomycetota bacterium]|nr:type II secretion system protein GspG [Planctomycetota bacterium]